MRGKRRNETADGYWQRYAGAAWWTTIDGQRRSTGCKDLDAARRWRAEQERRRVHALSLGSPLDGALGGSSR